MTARDAVGNDKIQRIDSRDHQGDEQGGFHSLPAAQAGQVPEHALKSIQIPKNQDICRQKHGMYRRCPDKSSLGFRHS